MFLPEAAGGGQNSCRRLGSSMKGSKREKDKMTQHKYQRGHALIHGQGDVWKKCDDEA